VPVHRIGVDEDEVTLLPVVALVVVDLVAASLEDVERRLVLMAVPVVRAVRRQFHEMDLHRLGEERFVTGPDSPPRPGFRGVPGVCGVVAGVGDDGVVPDPWRRELFAAKVTEPVGLGIQSTNERASAGHATASLPSRSPITTQVGLRV
jgi:hypothetical protein